MRISPRYDASTALFRCRQPLNKPAHGVCSGNVSRFQPVVVEKRDGFPAAVGARSHFCRRTPCHGDCLPCRHSQSTCDPAPTNFAQWCPHRDPPPVVEPATSNTPSITETVYLTIKYYVDQGVTPAIMFVGVVGNVLSLLFGVRCRSQMSSLEHILSLPLCL